MTIPLQVKANTHLEIQHHDLIGLATEEQNKKNREFLSKQNQTSFDLQNGSVLDICLVSLSPRNIASCRTSSLCRFGITE